MALLRTRPDRQDPAAARTLLQQILDSGIEGQTRDDAQAQLKQLR